MPLPNPSKSINKAFKKPHLKPHPPSHSTLPALPPKWRVRVVCTDPDATDDSSADEADASPPPPSLSRKRLLREICLPSPLLLTTPPSHSPPRPTQSPRPTKIRQIEHLPPTPPSPQDRTALHSYAAAAAAAAAIEEEEEEGFARFLSEFMQEVPVWEYDIHSRGAERVAEMLDLELDAEVLAWINSMQRLP